MAAALEVADIFRRHGEAFRQAHAGHLGGVERRIVGDITACRTAVLGGHVKQCDDCGATRIAFNPCRNRHCPKCQGLARAQWLAQRQPELLPLPYFHVVFTLPAPVGEIAFQNKAAVYAILLRAADRTLATIAADPRHLSARRDAMDMAGGAAGSVRSLGYRNWLRVVSPRSSVPSTSVTVLGSGHHSRITTDSRDSISSTQTLRDRDRGAAHLLSDQKRLLFLIWIFKLYAFVAATIGSLMVATVNLKKTNAFAISTLVAFAM